MKFIYITFFLFVLSCGKSQRINKESYILSLKSDTLVQNGKYKEALKVIYKALEIDNKNYIAYNNLGGVKHLLGYPEKEVLNAFYKCHDLNENYIIGFYNLVGSNFEYQHYKEVIKLGKLYIEKVERTGENFHTRSEIYAKIGEAYNYLYSYNNALKHLTNSIEIEPNHAEVYKERGTANRHLGNLSKALDDFNKAISLSPEYYQAYNSRAILYEDLKEYKLALADYEKAIKLNSKLGIYHFNKATLLIDLGRIEDGCKELTIAKHLGYSVAKSYIEKYCN